jgi:hypothetical protein
VERCKVEGCEKPSFRRGWCNMHYTRWRRYGDLSTVHPNSVRRLGACSVDGCEADAISRNLCNKHYQRWLKYGDPLAVEGHDRTPEQRFWTMVSKTETCWLWTGGLSRGYAMFWLDGKNVKAHRFAYELLVGPIPEGLVLDHVVARGCKWRHCVNPAHLEPVTERVNILRGDSPLAASWRQRNGG